MFSRKPRLIPVLDVMHGQAVQARGGERHRYQPLKSRLTDSTDPAQVAQALVAATSTRELYVADLDSIQNRSVNQLALGNILQQASAPVWLDLGVRPNFRIPVLPNADWIRHVVALETCRSPLFFQDCLTAYGPENVAFSLDLQACELLGQWRDWGVSDAHDALGMVRRVWELGCRHLIVLDLAHVGMRSGGGTDELLRTIREGFPEIQIIAGGGIRDWADIDRLGDLGVDAVLVATALHTGAISFPRPDSQASHP